MTLIVQNDSGTVTGANSYVSVAEFKTYHDARGNSYGTASDANIGKAIIKATDYLDTRFNFRGNRANIASSQTTAWPRNNVVDADDNWVSGIPDVVQRACSEYALRALTITLNPDPVLPDDSGRAIKRISKRADIVSKEVEYSVSTAHVLPNYPVADRLLIAAGLIEANNEWARG